MKKIIPMIALLVSSVAMANSEPFIAVSANGAITILKKNTKIPVNVLFTKDICYSGTPGDVIEIIQQAIANRGSDYALQSLSTFTTARGSTQLTVEIANNIQPVKLQIKPCEE